MPANIQRNTTYCKEYLIFLHLTNQIITMLTGYNIITYKNDFYPDLAKGIFHTEERINLRSWYALDENTNKYLIAVRVSINYARKDTKDCIFEHLTEFGAYVEPPVLPINKDEIDSFLKWGFQNILIRYQDNKPNFFPNEFARPLYPHFERENIYQYLQAIHDELQK